MTLIRCWLRIDAQIAENCAFCISTMGMEDLIDTTRDGTEISITGDAEVVAA